MYKVRTYNNISVRGLDRFSREKYEVASEINTPDGILLRSHVLQDADLPESVQAIARAGAGVNNVPVADCTARGIPVFNTPGANANAVKELVLTAMLLGSRGILQGIQYVNGLGDMTDSKEMSVLLEKQKKQFKGSELKGKTLGVVGLGAIGSMVAEMGLDMGMEVIGYDPALSVAAAWRLPSEVKQIENLTTLFAKADYVTLHLPVLDSTRNLVNAETLKSFKPDGRLINFAREQIVDTKAVVEALDNNELGMYIADFPTPDIIGNPKAILMPHIGASTEEAEDNCAIMAVDQLQDFLENGNIRNSVNFPAINLERTTPYRICVVNKNIPKMLGSVTSVLADADINVCDMLNKSRDEIACNLIDTDSEPSAEVLAKLEALEGVIKVRLLQ